MDFILERYMETCNSMAVDRFGNYCFVDLCGRINKSILLHIDINIKGKPGNVK